MNQKQVEKIIGYVSSMVEIHDEDPATVISELNRRDTKADEAILKVYSSIEGEAFCTHCSIDKLRDEQKGEYYCPNCD